MKPLIVLIYLLLLTGCGIVVDYTEPETPSLWQVISYSDSVTFKPRAKNCYIDSVKDLSKDQMILSSKQAVLKWPATGFNPGINELNWIFYLNSGKKRRVRERFYMVSDILPDTLSFKEYYTIPHDTAAFTQGLIFRNGFLYESTGLAGRSMLRKINPVTGAVVDQYAIPDSIFAEGLTCRNDTLWMLSWKDGKCFAFNHDLIKQKEMHYRREGWGLTAYNGCFIASNGSEKLFFQHHLSSKASREMSVFNHSGPVRYLNELELVDDLLWANILGNDQICVINMESGQVVKVIDMSACIDREQFPEAGVLNGIAYNCEKQEFYLTGKNWPFMIVALKKSLKNICSSNMNK